MKKPVQQMEETKATDLTKRLDMIMGHDRSLEASTTMADAIMKREKHPKVKFKVGKTLITVKRKD